MLGGFSDGYVSPALLSSADPPLKVSGFSIHLIQLQYILAQKNEEGETSRVACTLLVRLNGTDVFIEENQPLALRSSIPHRYRDAFKLARIFWAV